MCRLVALGCCDVRELRAVGRPLWITDVDAIAGNDARVAGTYADEHELGIAPILLPVDRRADVHDLRAVGRDSAERRRRRSDEGPRSRGLWRTRPCALPQQRRCRGQAQQAQGEQASSLLREGPVTRDGCDRLVPLDRPRRRDFPATRRRRRSRARCGIAVHRHSVDLGASVQLFAGPAHARFLPRNCSPRKTFGERLV